MAKSEKNLQAVEEFIRRVMERNFRQKVDPKELRMAAERLYDTLPAGFDFQTETLSGKEGKRL